MAPTPAEATLHRGPTRHQRDAETVRCEAAALRQRLSPSSALQPPDTPGVEG